MVAREDARLPHVTRCALARKTVKTRRRLGGDPIAVYSSGEMLMPARARLSTHRSGCYLTYRG